MSAPLRNVVCHTGRLVDLLRQMRTVENLAQWQAALADQYRALGYTVTIIGDEIDVSIPNGATVDVDRLKEIMNSTPTWMGRK